MRLKKFIYTIAACVTALAMTGCGGKNGDKGSEYTLPDYIYVPEYVEFDSNARLYSSQIIGDEIYYLWTDYDESKGEETRILKKKNVKTKEDTELFSINETNPEHFCILSDGSVGMVSSSWNFDEATGESSNTMDLIKLSSEGEEMTHTNLNGVVDTQEEYVNGILSDEKGRFYIIFNRKIVLADETGTVVGNIDLSQASGGWINSWGNDSAGNVYVSYDSGDKMELSSVDFDRKALGTTYTGFPRNNGKLWAGQENELLTQGNGCVYAYDLNEQKKELLFQWLDSDINGDYVSNCGMTQDGKIIALISDWNTEEYCAALLTKTPRSQVTDKEMIVVGSMYNDNTLQEAAVKFNKENDKYRVTIRTYMDIDNWSDNSYQDAITKMNNDITSKNAPDIINISNLNMEQLVAKGVFEDLGAYLDKSEKLSRDAFIDHILDNFTQNDVLVAIPKSFYLMSVIGSEKDLGTRNGWTLDEMIAYADAHPDASIFDNITRETMLYYCMMFNEGAFIDWKTGDCFFDKPEFISLLEFIKRFPSADDMEFDYEVSTAKKIQSGEVLLCEAYLSDFREIQLYDAMFNGATTFIGFPTVDGSQGTAINATELYAITSKSKEKEGAWSFIEDYLTRVNEHELGYYGFPTLKSQLDQYIEQSTKVETYTWTDENGEEHVEEMGGGSMSYQDGWTYEYHTPTKEDVGKVLQLLENCRPVVSANDGVLGILTEEAQGFFKGGKSAAEVAETIQKRVQIYVSENS